MRLKHIESKISPYFIFGTHKDGYVDIASADYDTLISHISVKDAERIIKDRDKVIELLYSLSEKCTEEFDIVWYNTKRVKN